MKKKFNIIYIIGIVLCVFLIISAIWLDYESLMFSTASLIPFCIWTGLFVLLIIEFILKKTPIVKSILFVLTIAIGLIIDVIFPSRDGLPFIFLCISGIPYLICYIVNIIINTKNISITNENNKTLSIGIFHKNDSKISLIFCLVIIAITIILALLFLKFEIDTDYIYFLGFIYLLIYFSIFFPKLYAYRLTNSINKELNLDKFISIADECLQQNLANETRNYICIMKANYLLGRSINEGVFEFDKTFRPNYKRFILLYDTLEIEVLTLKREFLEASKKIDLLKSKRFKINLSTFLKICSTDEVISNIEEIYPTNNRIRMAALESCYIKMYYYESRNNHQKAKECANMILGFNSNLDGYNTSAKEVLDDNYDLNSFFYYYSDNLKNESIDLNENINSPDEIIAANKEQ